MIQQSRELRGAGPEQKELGTETVSTPTRPVMPGWSEFGVQTLDVLNPVPRSSPN